MKTNIKSILLFPAMFIIVFTAKIHAQESVTTSGGNNQGANGSVSYTVGQVFLNTNADTSTGSESQGVQQAFEITTLSWLDEAAGIKLSCAVYPNPVEATLVLSIDGAEPTALHYHLLNESGKLLESRCIKDPLSSIDMQDLPPALYFLRIIKNTTEVKTFKIIKN